VRRGDARVALFAVGGSAAPPQALCELLLLRLGTTAAACDGAAEELRLAAQAGGGAGGGGGGGTGAGGVGTHGCAPPAACTAPPPAAHPSSSAFAGCIGVRCSAGNDFCRLYNANGRRAAGAEAQGALPLEVSGLAGGAATFLARNPPCPWSGANLAATVALSAASPVQYHREVLSTLRRAFAAREHGAEHVGAQQCGHCFSGEGVVRRALLRRADACGLQLDGASGWKTSMPTEQERAARSARRKRRVVATTARVDVGAAALAAAAARVRELEADKAALQRWIEEHGCEEPEEEHDGLVHKLQTVLRRGILREDHFLHKFIEAQLNVALAPRGHAIRWVRARTRARRTLMCCGYGVLALGFYGVLFCARCAPLARARGVPPSDACCPPPRASHVRVRVCCGADAVPQHKDIKKFATTLYLHGSSTIINLFNGGMFHGGGHEKRIDMSKTNVVLPSVPTALRELPRYFQGEGIKCATVATVQDLLLQRGFPFRVVMSWDETVVAPALALNETMGKVQGAAGRSLTVEELRALDPAALKLATAVLSIHVHTPFVHDGDEHNEVSLAAGYTTEQAATDEDGKTSLPADRLRAAIGEARDRLQSCRRCMQLGLRCTPWRKKDKARCANCEDAECDCMRLLAEWLIADSGVGSKPLFRELLALIVDGEDAMAGCSGDPAHFLKAFGCAALNNYLRLKHQRFSLKLIRVLLLAGGALADELKAAGVTMETVTVRDRHDWKVFDVLSSPRVLAALATAGWVVASCRTAPDRTRACGGSSSPARRGAACPGHGRRHGRRLGRRLGRRGTRRLRRGPGGRGCRRGACGRSRGGAHP
jgi:hypothetical protein